MVLQDELWARQELSDSPITTAAHEFNCTVAARAMLAMYHTKSDLFAVAEVELLLHLGGTDVCGRRLRPCVETAF